MKIKYNLLLLLAISSMAVCAQNKRRPTQKASATKTASNIMSAKAKAMFDEMLPNTQKIFIIDSVIVDKDKVLEAIPLPEAYGKYVSYTDFFDKENGDNYVFVNGFGNRCYYTELGSDSISRLYTCDKLGDKWNKPRTVTEINDKFQNISFPYMSSDGQTLYFAAQSEEESLGKRDIFMAKYAADEDRFLEPENIGLPFNSTSDDLFYIEADADQMAWFATTRRQAEGKVCVYTFVPSQVRHNYSSDELPDSKLRNLANIVRIRDTWPTPEIRDKEVKRLDALKLKAQKESSSQSDINFIVNDNTIYHNLSDFLSDETRKMYYDVERLQADVIAKQQQLEDLRTKYHNASAQNKSTLGSQIISLENKLAQSRTDLKTATSNLRQKENKLIKK